MSKETPILFKDDLIRRILGERKTQTRRIAALNASGRVSLHGRQWHPGDPEAVKACPYGQAGDRLWVKEAFRRVVVEQDGLPVDHFLYRADKAVKRVPVSLRGDGRWDRLRAWEKEHPYAWRSPLLMFREASRIDLEIESVRLERLQAITDGEAVAEGVDPCRTLKGEDNVMVTAALHHLQMGEFSDMTRPATVFGKFVPTARFMVLWDTINSARGYGWKTNPLVWVVEFRLGERRVK